MITKEFLTDKFTYLDGKLIRNSNGKEVKCTKSKWHRYLRLNVDGKIYYLHRVIFLYHHGYMPELIDHIDGDRYNNKIDNLREATQQQNCLNKKHHVNSSSKCKNVYWHKLMNKWTVRMTVAGIRKCIGYFDDLELADLVAYEARDKYHGKFARDF